ncbi:MAG: TlpA disulfide reductase family protein [Chloroflexota bacterium]
MIKANELITERWLNTDRNITLDSLRGKVVIIFAFQMLCPGCVQYCIPQSKQVYDVFHNEEVVVLGLHTVFEHHEAMQEPSLRAFLHEYGIRYPVAIDMTGVNSPMPQTMEQYRMRGTPTTILIDRGGHLRKQHFGHLPDMVLGAEIMALIKG